MGKHFNIEMRKTCRVCGKPLPKRFRTFCSKKCRQYDINQRHNEAHTIWQRERNNKIAMKPSKDKIQCLLCGRWYRQVGSHIVQVHKITAREYRSLVGFDVKRGQLPDDLRQLYREQVFKNKTVKNLKAGKKFRFVKGDPRAGKYERSAQTLERLRTQSKNMKTLRGTKFYKSLNHYLAAAYAEGFCEGEGASEKEQLSAWQYLIDTGACWKLQGWFGRTAQNLIEQGLCLKAK